MLGKLNHPAEINVSEIKSLDLKSNNGRAVFHLPRAVVALCMTYGACVCFWISFSRRAALVACARVLHTVAGAPGICNQLID